MKVHKGKYGQVHLIALLTAGLSRYHNEFAVAVVDEVNFCLLVVILLTYEDFVLFGKIVEVMILAFLSVRFLKNILAL